MLVRQSKNTYIRCTNDYGYITNQLTYHDRTYNETGADFLREISRQPQDVDDIVGRLLAIYRDISFIELKADFLEVITELAEKKFLVIGNSIEGLNKNDVEFSYELENPKTFAYDFTQTTNQDVKENTQEFFLEEVQRRPRLIAVQIELTSRCNERCIHCYIPNWKKDKGCDMETEKVFAVIDEFASLGGLHITLSGGEVFLHKDIDKILRYCREKDMKISVLSNLLLLSDKYIPMLKEVNISLIQTSLYSLDPEIHDKITKVYGSFSNTKRAIEKLVSADIPVQISCPIMKANAKGYGEVLKYANSFRIKAYTDFIMMGQSDFDRSNLDNRLSIQETEDLLKDIINFDKNYIEGTLKLEPVSNQIKFDLERFKQQPICSVGIDNCCINENGDIYPCAGWQGMVLGNVFEQSLQEIWDNSEVIKQLRNVTQASFPKCLKCEARNYCAMCLVRNYNENGGDMFKITKHFCDVAFLNKKMVENHFNNK